MSLRVISNMKRLSSAQLAGMPIDVIAWPRSTGWSTVLLMFLRSFHCDYVLINAAPRLLLSLALLKTIVPFGRCRLVAIDVLLPRPVTAAGRLRALVRAGLLRRVHRVLLYYKDTSELQREYSLPAYKFDYVPFKINEYNLVVGTTASDRGYVFCGGKTMRDFKTFLAAVEPLGVPVKIATTSNDDIAQHGSFLEDMTRPAHVEIVRLDGSVGPFIEAMAGARVVVLPLKPSIVGVGIGVCLMAMALGKCVVITEGPSTRGVLNPDLAVLVRPESPEELRDAIRAAYENDDLRRRLGENGRRYALSLGDEMELLKRVVGWLHRDHNSRKSS